VCWRMPPIVIKITFVAEKRDSERVLVGEWPGRFTCGKGGHDKARRAGRWLFELPILFAYGANSTSSHPVHPCVVLSVTTRECLQWLPPVSFTACSSEGAFSDSTHRQDSYDCDKVF